MKLKDLPSFPNRQNYGLRVIPLLNGPQANHVLVARPNGTPALDLDQDHLEEVASVAFEGRVVLSDGKEVHHAPRLSSSTSREVHELPPSL